MFEYWAHEASLVLTEDLPVHRWTMRNWGGGNGVWHQRAHKWWEVNADFRQHLLDRLRARRPAPGAGARRPRGGAVAVERLDATSGTSPACST